MLSNHCQLKMNAVTSVYQCLFCQQVFSSASLKDDHILEHFAQEMCTDCDQNLIRIGSKMYTIHNAVTCIKRDATSDEAIEKKKPVEAVNSENQHRADIERPSKASDFEEILIKLEDEEEGVKENQDLVQVHGGTHEIIEVEVEEESPNGDQEPEYIIIDLNDIPLVRERSTDRTQSICQPNAKLITKCDVCGQEFDCVFFLESHRKLKHPTATAATAANKIDGLASNTNAQAPIVKTPSKGTKSIMKSKPIVPVKPTERLECLLCNKLYKSEHSLRNHIDTIHDPSARKFKCEICGSAFFREAALQNHHENQHLDMKKFQCGICNTGLKSKIALERHMFQHSGKKPYKCTWEDCKKTFTCTANRDEHYRSHTGEKKFLCTIEGCGNRYTFAADIRKHKYKIHNIFPKKFPCQFEKCTQVFPQRAMLKKHMKKHSKKR